MTKKYYAVKKGRIPGIYLTWEDCRQMVEGFQGAEYKGFGDIREAEDFLDGIPYKKPGNVAESMTDCGELPVPYAFVDGSFCETTGVYGFGGFLQTGEQRLVLQGSGSDEELAPMRNVAGELLGSMAAMEKAIALGLSELTIYYDYLGIEMWATGQWKRNKAGTIAYHDYVRSVEDRLTLHFHKVKGHSGIPGNEEADRLAKEAAGIL